MIKLLEESGYVENRKLINIEILKEYISKNLKLADLWIQYSEDQRFSPAWVFNGKELYYLTPEVKKENSITFDDPCEACAYFIIKEIHKFYKYISRFRKIIRYIKK